MHGIAQFAFQIIAAQQSVVFEVPDDGFDGIAAFEGAFESPGVYSSLLPGFVNGHVRDLDTTVS